MERPQKQTFQRTFRSLFYCTTTGRQASKDIFHKVFGVGFALLLPRFFGLDGVLYSMPMSDILTFLIAGYLICKTYRELNGKGEL